MELLYYYFSYIKYKDVTSVKYKLLKNEKFSFCKV